MVGAIWFKIPSFGVAPASHSSHWLAAGTQESLKLDAAAPLYLKVEVLCFKLGKNSEEQWFLRSRSSFCSLFSVNTLLKKIIAKLDSFFLESVTRQCNSKKRAGLGRKKTANFQPCCNQLLTAKSPVRGRTIIQLHGNSGRL